MNITRFRRKIIRQLLLIDICLNTIIFKSKKRRTLSESCGEQIYKGEVCRFCKIIDWITHKFEPNHCLVVYIKYNRSKWPVEKK